jgi:hypothetical protein
MTYIPPLDSVFTQSLLRPVDHEPVVYSVFYNWVRSFSLALYVFIFLCCYYYLLLFFWGGVVMFRTFS